MKLQSAIAALCIGISASAAVPAADTEARIEELLGKMTLEEKVGQLNQYTGSGYSADMAGRVKAGMVGSILNEVDPETVNALQRDAVENSRLGIPLVFARDVIHGFRTIFPIPLGQGATWNPALVEEGSAIAAAEASSAGIRWTFSPMVDIARDARWGRIAEGYGEDPVLTSAMGVAAVKGYQGDDLSKPGTMAACVKHFACYGAAESGRDYNTTWVPMELLHDVYLPPFKAGAKAGAATFMCSFNDINGVPSSGNSYLLRDLLRNQWNWDGLMVSDWNSISEMINHGFSADRRDAALKAALAGVDMDMEGHAYDGNLAALVEGGQIPVEVIDNLVRNVLRLKFRLGLFENPYVDMATANRFYTPEALDAARRTAEEGTVMLKNSGILPLAKKPGRIFVTGPMADAMHDQNGTWCFDLDKTHTVTPLAALRQRYGDAVAYLPGLTYSRDKNTDFSEALKAAADADVILYFAGEEAVLSGEAHSRADITLPGSQTEYLRRLAATGKPVVTVIMAGRPLAIPEECALSEAVLYSFHPGTMGGPALANILDGTVAPGGKLPVCMPRMSGQMPLYYARKNTGRPTTDMTLIDDIPLEAGQTSTGCTSFFLDAGHEALFPFGFGLSYTDFEYSRPTVSSTEMAADGSISVSCTVTNIGKTAGSDVAQLYVRDPLASLARPVKELKAFEKFSLAPGESRDIVFTLPASALAFHNSKGEPVVEPGEFHLWVDNSSQCKSEPVIFEVK
ncbi:MAG: glycoside hydrolase family 3 C-terminal domain-containing protein [Muribaculaceae bacterium]|nr:glycoside hydrolase family 3 C-terminal domain-containing protein [Muribaculaceae bacterium]